MVSNEEGEKSQRRETNFFISQEKEKNCGGEKKRDGIKGRVHHASLGKDSVKEEQGKGESWELME